MNKNNFNTLREKDIIKFLLLSLVKKQREVEEFANILKENTKVFNFIDIEFAETLSLIELADILEIKEEGKREKLFEKYGILIECEEKDFNNKLNEFCELLIN